MGLAAATSTKKVLSALAPRAPAKYPAGEATGQRRLSARAKTQRRATLTGSNDHGRIGSCLGGILGQCNGLPSRVATGAGYKLHALEVRVGVEHLAGRLNEELPLLAREVVRLAHGPGYDESNCGSEVAVSRRLN